MVIVGMTNDDKDHDNACGSKNIDDSSDDKEDGDFDYELTIL